MKTNLIKFQNNELIAVTDYDGQIYVAIKPICDAIGLNHDSACAGIKNHQLLGPATQITMVQVGEDQPRNYITLPLDMVNGWLFTINANKIRIEARENLLIYQSECFKVLYDHFFGISKKIIDKNKASYTIQCKINNVNKSLLDLRFERANLKKELHSLRTSIYSQLDIFSQPETLEII